MTSNCSECRISGIGLVLAMSLLLAGCRPAAEPEPAPETDPEDGSASIDASPPTASFRARGNEPFWSLEMDAMALAWRPMEGPEQVYSHLVRTPGKGRETVIASLDGKTITLDIQQGLCRDSMSGMPYPQAVSVRIDGRELQGCGGEAIELLTAHSWAVAMLAGASTSAPAPTLQFTAEGRASGFAGCNRWMGAAALSGEGLSFQQTASTMMACTEDTATRQEQAFLAALARVTRHDFDANGNLLLKAGDETLIVATPMPAEAPAAN